MKVGILTVYDSANYGAFLQAYASKTLLESWGHEVYFIKIRSEEERKMVYTKRIHKLRDVYPYYKNYKFNIEKFEMMKKDIDKLKIVSLEDKEELAKLDWIMIGSDEVWNINVPLFQRNIFYGGDLNNNNVFSFAVSAGMATIDTFKKYDAACNQMKKLKYIAVRDENTKKIASSITDKEVELVCDPTLMVEKECFPSYERMINEPYMLVYSYYISYATKNKLKKFAKDNKLKLVSVCTKHDFCDYNLNISPLQFSSVVEHAEFVYASTFHGAIFTFINHKKCIIMSEQKKVNDLLKRYHMEGQKLAENCSYDEFSALLQRDVDYARFEKTKQEIADSAQNVLNSFIL